MARAPAKQSGKKTGGLKQEISIPALKVTQGDHVFYAFVIKASKLWPMISINRREEEEDRGYQRVLSTARTSAVAKHIKAGNPIPNSILISLDAGKYAKQDGMLTIPAGKDIGWVIDGQHRVAGAYEALPDVDIEFCVFAFVNVEQTFQIEQFVTINSEAKGVPTSLVYDLLSYLPSKTTAAEIARERAITIAKELRTEASGPFKNRIVTTQSPKNGQISITNFVRKVSPLLHPEKGNLKSHTQLEQQIIIRNYFDGIKITFPEQWKKSDNIFFKTIGFGAMMNLFEDIFHFAVTEQTGFAPQDVHSVLRDAEDFDFAQWRSTGTGNKAEQDAALEFKTVLLRARSKNPDRKGLRLA
jgi:DGQHR domain-containing protein